MLTTPRYHYMRKAIIELMNTHLLRSEPEMTKAFYNHYGLVLKILEYWQRYCNQYTINHIPSRCIDVMKLQRDKITDADFAGQQKCHQRDFAKKTTGRRKFFSEPDFPHFDVVSQVPQPCFSIRTFSRGVRLLTTPFRSEPDTSSISFTRVSKKSSARQTTRRITCPSVHLYAMEKK